MTEAPAYAIRQRAHREVRPLIACTLAECLFWFQRAQHTIDGQRALWKTGPELEAALGIKARTANEHLKELARAGFWRIVLRPRPGFGSPSPVTWLIPTPRSLALIAEAGELAIKASSQRTAQRRRSKPLSGGPADVQTSVSQTVLSLPDLPSPATDFKFPSETKAKSKSNSPKTQAGEGAPEEIKAFVKKCQDRFIQRNQDVWDLSSKYTWLHAETFYRRLESEGLGHSEVQSAVDDLLKWWPGILDKLPCVYRHHSGNMSRPTPKVLGDEADLVTQVLLVRRAAAVVSAAKASAPKSKFKF